MADAAAFVLPGPAVSYTTSCDATPSDSQDSFEVILLAKDAL